MRMLRASGPLGGHRDLVVFDLEVLWVAEEAGVDLAEVGYVVEVFEDAGAVGFEGVGAGLDEADVLAGVGEGEGGWVVCGFGERDPDDAVAFAGGVGFGAGFGGWGEVGLGGDEDALAGGGVVPGVIGADDAVLLDLAEGEAGSAVDAEVAPGVEGLVGGAPEDEVAVEETAGDELACGDLVGEGDGEPLGEEDGVV
jgi:hypothetical protein